MLPQCILVSDLGNCEASVKASGDGGIGRFTTDGVRI